MNTDQGTRNSRRLIRLMKRDGPKCFWCGHPLLTHRQMRSRQLHGKSTHGYRMATVDHVIPRSKGGPSFLWNLVAACNECNVERSRPGNLIDERIRNGVYKLPKRMGPDLPLPAPRRKSNATEPVEVVSQDRYVQAIPWHTTDVPKSTGLYLVVQPGRWRILLVPIEVGPLGACVVQGTERRSWNPVWWWCPLDDLLDDAEGEGEGEK